MNATRMLLAALFLSLGVSTINVPICSTARADEVPLLAPMKAAHKPKVYGWVEEVMLEPEHGWKFEAKLDTGADTSSLDARGMRRVRVGDKSYVRFSIRNPKTRKRISLRRPYVRTVRIRQHDGRNQRRRVVLMTVCLGERERVIEVTLTDRSKFEYPMLLGRSALSGLAIVDPMIERTREPTCWTDGDPGKGAVTTDPASAPTETVASK